jgi:hypothetical protein
MKAAQFKSHSGPALDSGNRLATLSHLPAPRGSVARRLPSLALALLAVATAAASPAGASVLVGGMTATSYQLPSPAADGYDSLSSQLTVLIEPGLSPYFWAQQFWFVGGNGGYIGLQANGLLAGKWVGKMASCSIWDSIDIRGGSCDRFGGEGVGFSCRAPYPWREGDEVRLSVLMSETTPSGTWWRCEVENVGTGAITVLGEIKVQPDWSGLQGAANTFAEYFDVAPSCSAFPFAVVRWRGIEASPGPADGVPATPSTYGNCALSAQAWCDEDGCYHATGFDYALHATLDKKTAHLTWVDGFTGEEKWLVEMSQGSGNFRTVKSLAPNTTTADVTGLRGHSIYHFRVRAALKNGYTAYSHPATVTVP